MFLSLLPSAAALSPRPLVDSAARHVSTQLAGGRSFQFRTTSVLYSISATPPRRVSGRESLYSIFASSPAAPSPSPPLLKIRPCLHPFPLSRPFLSRSTTMSYKRSAFDVLMDAGKKRTLLPQNPEPSHKKTMTTTTELKPEPSHKKTTATQVPNPVKTWFFKPHPELSVRAASSVAELKKKAANFDPRKAAYWGEADRVPFLFVVKALEVIQKESGKINIVCNVLRTVIEMTPTDLLPTVYLLANRIAPPSAGMELGIGDALIIKVLSEAYGSKEAHIKAQFQTLGDLGLVAKASHSSQSFMFKPEALTVRKVFDTLVLIAKETGKDSQEKKKNRIKALLVAATDCEPQYLIRLLRAKLRVGSAEINLLTALGHAAVYAQKQFCSPANVNSLEEAAEIVKQVYSVFPVYDKIIPALLDAGVWNLSKTFHFSPGVPVGPMLAIPIKRISEIFNKFHDTVFTCEYKYDGQRAQIHYMDNGSVEIYSRKSERNTGKFPDVVEAIARVKKSTVTSFVLDCELVAYDREKKNILSCQVLNTRARKNVTASEVKVGVCIFAFDVLHVNGQPLIHEQLEKRREHLYNSFVEESGYFQFARELTSNDLEEIQNFLEAAVDSSTEGLVIKTLSKDATYEPSRRSNNWLKLKKDYMESIGDSLDLVPIAAFHGQGRRTGLYGAFLLACYDSDKEEFQSICKIATGFTDVVLKEQSLRLESHIITEPKSYYRFSESLNPDVWFEPTEVWEVKAADLTISPVHRAATGIVYPDKGISLRFPRLLRVREDKKPEDATSSEMVADMFRAQKHYHNPENDEEDDEESGDE